jgi:hypothetical protein
MAAIAQKRSKLQIGWAGSKKMKQLGQVNEAVVQETLGAERALPDAQATATSESSRDYSINLSGFE